MAEFAVVLVTQSGRLGIELEVFHEAGAGEAKGFGLSFPIFGEGCAFLSFLFQGFEKFLSRIDAIRSEIVGTSEASRTGFHVGEVDIAVACSEKSRSATDVGKTNEHVSGNVRISRAFLMGHDRADGWIDRRSAGGAPGVDEVGSNGVFVDQAMIAGANCGDLFHALGELREMFADLNSFHCSVDGRIIGTRFEGLFRAALFFRIECIDLRSAAAEPD